VDLYSHLAQPVDLQSVAASPQQQSSVEPGRRPDTITKVVETGDEGRAGLLFGQIAP
jgi:hypothetical protein